MSLGKDLYDSLMEEPARWIQGQWCIERDDGIAIWTINGLSFIALHRPCEIKLPFKWRWRIRRAVKTMHKRLKLSDLVG